MNETPRAPDPLGILRNRTFDEIAVGDSERLERTLSAQDIQLYAVLSGDDSIQNLDEHAVLFDFCQTRHSGGQAIGRKTMNGRIERRLAGGP